MADSPASAPVVPAVASFDPVEWTKKMDILSARINGLESDKQDLQRERDLLRSQLAQQTSAAASARGAMKPMKEQIDTLRAELTSSQDVKEMARLRAEVAVLHAEGAKMAKMRIEEDRKSAAQFRDFSERAARAESKFQSLEGTASMMAASRDKSNASAATLLSERDAAQQKVGELQAELEGMRTEFVKVRTDLEKSQAEAKALRQAPAIKAK